ncbi:ParB N-terminal domain-containing protein [Streptomyces sp. NPDC096191]|uniref:ParB/RepB/Spo0J family partition protein n=1 Tax=Streptomyces sp. NPDC096191 TaxID=3155426 RepID=UPI00331F42D8
MKEHHAETGNPSDAATTGGRPEHLHTSDATVHMVKISDLVAADSPRSESESAEHARMLADSGAELPPVIVHASTMRLIDGAHRVKAALIRGDTEIAARFYDGSDRDAFALAVAANIQHGLPLTRKERTDAAARVITSNPQWSDRAVAAVTGLAADTIRRIRSRASAATEQLHDRVGRDGRVRPLSSADGRIQAAQYITDHPQASLREVAAASGLSPGTVRDVRERLRQNHDPVPASQRRIKAARPSPTHAAPIDRTGQQSAAVKAPPERTGSREPLDLPLTARQSPPHASLSALRRDPSIRHSEAGRLLLRLLDNRLLSQAHGDELIAALPQHSLGNLSAAARECAHLWAEFSKRLDRRM